MAKNQTAIAITSFLILTIALTLITLPSANAQSSGELASYPFIVVAPNPVGVGQTTYISMLVDNPLPDSSEANDIRRHNYKLTITAPNGNTETKSWDVIDDTTGVQFTSYTPNQVGIYSLKFEYGGQTYTWNANSAQQAAYGTKYLPATVTTTFTAQEAAILPTPDTPLPTEYWTRPIHGENSNWYLIGSHWLGGSYFGTFQQSGYNLWQPDGTGPDSGHIMWTYPLEAGGVVGGTRTGVDGATYYSGGSYEGRFSNSMILDGRIFFESTLSNNANSGPYTCVDLRTGEVLWKNADISPTFGELYCYESPNQHGVVPNGYLWQTAGTTWRAYDALTGLNLFNLTDVPSGTDVYTQNGEIVRYVLNYNTTTRSGWLALWNWTAAPDVALGAPGSGTNALQYRPVGKSINCSKAYSWNITITADLTGRSSPGIVAILPGDIMLGRSSSSISAGVARTRGTDDPYTVWAISLKDSSKGQLLWKKNYPAPSNNLTRTLGPVDPVNRVWMMTDAENMQWLGYSLDDGTLLWGPTTTAIRAMQFFSSGSGAGQRAVTAYGKIFVQGFGGEIFCYDTADGTLLWKFNNTDSGIDTSWGLMPIFIAAVADGKVYAFNNEHSPNSPLYNGYCIYCIDAITGEEIYKMLSWSGQVGGTGTSTALLADGYLVYYNYYDNQIYAVGKGPSDTSVTASPKISVNGDRVLVEGSVIDTAAGASQHEQAARFPDGVPAVSDDSMSAWMEYVYMQQSMPTNVIGVEVIISVFDPNGNRYEVGRTMSDASGMFKLAFVPEVPGEYTVIAAFAGSGSYYGSYAETAVYVEDAPAATPEPTKAPASLADQYLLPATGGIIAAIAVVGVVLALLLRKK